MEAHLDPARLTYWMNKPEWTVQEFVFLHRGYEPNNPDLLIGIEGAAIKSEIEQWRDWAKGCPAIQPAESHPALVPVQKSILIRWAKSLKGVEIPAWMEELLDPPQSAPNPSKSPKVGERAEQTLLMTIGALALALVEANGKVKGALKADTGTAECPNVSGLVRQCQKIAGESRGMSKSNLSCHISKGIDLIKGK